MERAKRRRLLRDTISKASLIANVILYIAFKTMRMYDSELTWNLVGYLYALTYVVFVITQMFDRENKSTEMLLLKGLLVFNFITLI